METGSAQLQARVQGRVQGVGFRMFVRDRARDLGLGGFVRNAADGAVEVAAYGPRPALESLLAALQRGPTAARVARVEVQWGAAPAESAGHFEVRA